MDTLITEKALENLESIRNITEKLGGSVEVDYDFSFNTKLIVRVGCKSVFLKATVEEGKLSKIPEDEMNKFYNFVDERFKELFSAINKALGNRG